MRPRTLLLLLIVPGLPPGVSGAQAVPRTDTPPAGLFRVTFEPVISTWEHEWIDGARRRIGASLPATVRVRAETRVTPLVVEFGITNRVAIGVRLPLVRQRTREFLVPDSAGLALDTLLRDSTYQFDPLVNTPRRLRFWPGDVEVEGKYRIVESPAWRLSGSVIVRLPTGHLDSPHRLFDIPTGDHQLDVEARVAQELIVGGRLWLNAALRLGRQQAGTRERRVGPSAMLLVPRAATARLDWDPGDYIGIDVAPMYRFSRHFAVGPTAAYWVRAHDHYAYRSAQDSIAVATALGSPVAARVLDTGTAERQVRLGVAISYMGSRVEGAVSIEQTVSATGGAPGAVIPAGSVFRVVMRTSRWPF
ncbi:MAG: hypothetical protein Q8Q14_02185 [Gemmatimonadales bacterium]|nr:hypothetical protein [Gemmatimonadales bacterium]